jgi:hypothetical protein
MPIIFFLFGLLIYFAAFLILNSADTAFQENTGFLIVLIGTVFIVGAGIMDTIKGSIAKLIDKLSTDQPDSKGGE